MSGIAGGSGRTKKVKTKDGEKMLAVGKSTKGLENAKDGAKVTIKYTGQLRASVINPNPR